jgi:cytochrome oxidase assembly protein ShyY1
VLTPLVLDDGSAVGVVRGWVAAADDPAAVAPAVPAGRVALTGYLRPAEPPASRPPGQGSGLPAGQIDRIDLTQLVTRWPQPLLTGYVVLTGYRSTSAATGPVAGQGTGQGVPVVPESLRPVPVAPAGDTGLDLRNLSYALQWFLFAGFGLFMWWRLVRDDARGVRDDEPSETAREGATL